MAWVIKAGGKTRYPRYYTGPVVPAELSKTVGGKDSAPFGHTRGATQFDSEQSASAVRDHLMMMGEDNTKWNREEVEKSEVVETDVSRD